MDPLADIPDVAPPPAAAAENPYAHGPSSMATTAERLERVKASMQANPHMLNYQTNQAPHHAMQQQHIGMQQHHALQQQQQMMLAYRTAAHQQQLAAYQTHQQQLAAYQTAVAQQQQVALYNGGGGVMPPHHQQQLALYGGAPQQQVALYNGGAPQGLPVVPAMDATRVERGREEYRVQRAKPNTRVSDSARAFGPLEDRLKKIAEQRAAERQ